VTIDEEPGGRAANDPDLAGYWENRRHKHGLPLDAGMLSPLGRQLNRCPRCESLLVDACHLPASPEAWEEWWFNITRQNIPPQPARPEIPGHRRKAGPFSP
jgi:hypothetical protein